MTSELNSSIYQDGNEPPLTDPKYVRQIRLTDTVVIHVGSDGLVDILVEDRLGDLIIIPTDTESLLEAASVWEPDRLNQALSSYRQSGTCSKARRMTRKNRR